VPEGDALFRAAQRLQVLVGQRLEVETPHPRARAERVAERLDGRRLLAVEPHGKNLLLRFEGDYVLRSHLRMRGRWTVVPRGTARAGRPWLVLRGTTHEGVLWNGPVLELTARRLTRLGPDILAEPLDADRIVRNVHLQPRERHLGDILLDQRVVAGIGNVWRAEALWAARVSPWRPLAETTDDELRAVLGEAHRLMRASVAGERPARAVYRRAGRPCVRCGATVLSRGQGDDNRTSYWCPTCQP